MAKSRIIPESECMKKSARIREYGQGLTFGTKFIYTS